MRRFLYCFLITSFFLFNVPKNTSVYAGQLYPQPGMNCGVGLDSKEFVKTNPDHAKYSCCYSDVVEHIGVDAEALHIPVIPSAIVSSIVGFINDRIDSFPFIMLPTVLTDRLPSVGKLKALLNASAKPCLSPAQPVGKLDSSDCFCYSEEAVTASLWSIGPMCERITNKAEVDACKECAGYNPIDKTYMEGGGIWTAIGCVKTSFSSFIKETIFPIGIGFAGAASLLCIIYAAFTMQTSGGSPEKVKKAQQILTSCITGLLLVIFSVFILRLIGVNILRIPGFQ